MKYLETNPEFYKKAAAIAIPITLQNLITIGINMMDTIMLGSLGETDRNRYGHFQGIHILLSPIPRSQNRCPHTDSHTADME